MDETFIVIMLKDEDSGFLEKELGCYNVGENEQLIYNTFATKKDEGYMVYMKLCCGKEVLDWEFDAIYDYYDFETLLPFVTSIKEEEDSHNPTWTACFDFIESEHEMEEKIVNILKLHKQELDSVFEAIADKKDDYAE